MAIRGSGLLFLSLAFFAAGCSAPESAAPARKPNIVFIVADDLGWTDTGAYGSEFYETPNIDRLAGEGMKFTSAYASPNCAPTRAALMTGRYSPRTGIYTVGSGARGREEFRKMIPAPNRTDLPLDELTFAEVLKREGYATAHMGKWHLGAGEHLPTAQGFDVNIAGNQTGLPRGGYFSPYENPQLPDGPEGEHLNDRLSREAVQFIEAHKDEPFLLYLPFYDVHTPIQAKEELIEKYRAKEPAGGHSHPVYAAMIETMDDGVGRVLGALDELVLAENTVVIFYSDNGGLGGYEAAGVRNSIEVTTNLPLRGGKGMIYEGGIRVPLIVRYPGVIAPGAVTDVPVTSVDFLPTLLEIAGAALPADREIDGASFAGTLRGMRSETAERPPLYWHFPGYLEGIVEEGAWRMTPAAAIRDGRYKLIEFFETGKIELYDLDADIGEQHDLAEAERETAGALHARLVEWRETLSAPMPEPK